MAIRRGNRFYGLVERQPGPSTDEYFFRHEFAPAEKRGDVRLVDSAFVEPMRKGWLVMIDGSALARGSLDKRVAPSPAVDPICASCQAGAYRGAAAGVDCRNRVRGGRYGQVE
jgi:hypothetical protein